MQSQLSLKSSTSHHSRIEDNIFCYYQLFLQTKLLSQIAIKGYCVKAACINIEARVRLVPDAEHDAPLLQSFKP